MMRQTNLLLGVGFASLALYLAVRKYRKYKQEPPKHWKKVGTLGDLMCFPIKSCGVVRAREMECTDLGLRIGWLRDRHFMVVNTKSDFLTARTYPKLVLIQPKAIDNMLILEAPGMDPLEIDLALLVESSTFNAKIWDDYVTSVDCGEAAAKWLSEFLLGESSGLRLVRYPKNYGNVVRTKETGIVAPGDTGAYPDETSYNIINASSIDDLNSRLNVPVIPQQFRPNFVVEGATPLEEDHWQWVKIGDVVFKAIKDCTRCILTTVDPATGEKRKDNEPLTTLKKYRIVKDNKQKAKPNTTQPVMGVHLVLKKAGTIRLGDAVMVG